MRILFASFLLAFSFTSNARLITKGDRCYDLCLDKKEGLFGKTVLGKDRPECQSCLSTHYSPKPSPPISNQESPGVIYRGDKCYDLCAPKKDGLFGKPVAGNDRPECRACISTHYPPKPPAPQAVASQEEERCTLSLDRVYAYCGNDVYKLDKSISDIDRQFLKEVERNGNTSRKPAVERSVNRE
jgi:hypothetical protein